jgi:hypothetical protein
MEENIMSTNVREFFPSDKLWHNTNNPGKLNGDGIQVAEGKFAGKVMKVALIIVQHNKSLEDNPEFVNQIRKVAKEADNIQIDEGSANKIRTFDQSLYNDIFKGKLL